MDKLNTFRFVYVNKLKYSRPIFRMTFSLGGSGKPDTRPLSTGEDPPPPLLIIGLFIGDEIGDEPNEPPPIGKDPPPTAPPIRFATAFKILATEPITSPGRNELTIST
jgi:hypothetical protein